MTSMMTDRLGISHRQLQVLAILWKAGEPLSRAEVMARFNLRYGESLRNNTFRSLIRTMDKRKLLSRRLAQREPGSMGATPVLYSPGVAAAQIISKLLDVIFGDILDDNPSLMTLAVRHLEKHRARVETDSSEA